MLLTLIRFRPWAREWFRLTHIRTFFAMRGRVQVFDGANLINQSDNESVRDKGGIPAGKSLMLRLPGMA